MNADLITDGGLQNFYEMNVNQWLTEKYIFPKMYTVHDL